MTPTPERAIEILRDLIRGKRDDDRCEVGAGVLIAVLHELEDHAECVELIDHLQKRLDKLNTKGAQ